MDRGADTRCALDGASKGRALRSEAQERGDRGGDRGGQAAGAAVRRDATGTSP
jgi:hypothetical protein